MTTAVEVPPRAAPVARCNGIVKDWATYLAGERRAEGSSGRYNRTVMSIKVAYRDGVFKPLEEVAGAAPGAIYTAFSKEELRDFIETVGWLKAAEKSFEFWDNPADAVYDTL